jgi:hypothetical protein
MYDPLYSYYLCGRSVYIDDVSISLLYMIYTSLHDLVSMHRISKQVVKIKLYLIDLSVDLLDLYLILFS